LSGNATALLRGVDHASFAVAFALRLRERGVPVGFTGIEDLTRALALHRPDSLSRLYWVARISLVRQRAEIAPFDAVFAEVFDDVTLALDPNARRKPLAPPTGTDDAFAPVPAALSEMQDGGGLPWATLPPVVAAADDSTSLIGVPERLPSELAGLPDVPFEQLSPRELELLGRWLESALVGWPRRRTRRLAVDPTGQRIAIRPTIARSRRTGWEPIDLVRVRQVRKPRRVLMLCDVSQSMHAQAAAYLHLMRGLALRADAEVFAFATSLTRLTAVLAHKSAAVAIEQATAKVTDRFGGTRIASNVQALLSSHHGGSARGAIVIIGSDGWDSDPPERLAAAMARLRRRAYRVIWMNPRASAPQFAPLVSTMAAALPYCDELLPADTFRSLAQLGAAISRC
jgi:uncharacterized protein with von Willebrand factor type A (vWA) domain